LVRPVRILTVDDSASFRNATRALVDHTPGFQPVGEAADGESALRLTRSEDPDMLIVDVRMDGMDGIDVAGRVRDEDDSRLVVLVSSGDVRDLTPLAESCGAAAVVRKHWLSPRLLRGLWVAHRKR
jgi:DNA-binding NarL/FixJ family response regulator